MMKPSLLWCLVALVIVCEFSFEVSAKSKGSKRRDRQRNRGGGRHHMCMCGGVMQRSGITRDNINCSLYDDVVNSDIAALYSDQHADVFQSWIDMLNAMTNREMEEGDDFDEVGADAGADDELMMMCKRKFCFKKKMREHIENGNELPGFCSADGRSSGDWQKLREADRPKPGERSHQMTVEKYTTIFCAKMTNPGMGKGGKGGAGGRRGRGRGGRGRGGHRRPGDRRRQRPSEAQEVPEER